MSDRFKALLPTRQVTDRLNQVADSQATNLRTIRAVVQSNNPDGTINVVVSAIDRLGASILAPVYAVRCLGAVPAPGTVTTLLASGRGRMISIGVQVGQDGAGFGFPTPDHVGMVWTVISLNPTVLGWVDPTGGTGTGTGTAIDDVMLLETAGTTTGGNYILGTAIEIDAALPLTLRTPVSGFSVSTEAGQQLRTEANENLLTEG